jgi:plastocyanin
MLFGIVLLLVAAVISACGPGGGGGGNTAAGGQTINVEGGEFFYMPTDIQAAPGEAITVNFKNTGTVEHTFVIPEVNFKLVATPGQTKTGSFTAPTTPGVYEIHCDIAGHTEAGMQGKLTVTAPTS